MDYLALSQIQFIAIYYKHLQLIASAWTTMVFTALGEPVWPGDEQQLIGGMTY